VGFFGDLYEEQAATIGRMRQRAGGAVAFVLDSDDWLAREIARLGTAGGAGRPGAESAGYPGGTDGTASPEGAESPANADSTERAVRMLREAGWTVVEVQPGATLPELWQQADRYRSREGEPADGSPRTRRGAGTVR